MGQSIQSIPADFTGIDFSYEHINNLIALKNDTLNELKPSTDIINHFNEFIKEYNHDFNMNEIVKYHVDKIEKSFFKDTKNNL